MDSPYVWIAIIGVIAIAVFLFFRSKKFPGGATAATPSLGEGASTKAPGAAAPKAKEAAPSARPPAAGAPGKAEQPVSIPAADVLVDESLTAQPALQAKPTKKDVAGLRKGLAATRGGFIARLTALFAGKKEIDPAILEQIEEVMLTSDVGVKTTQSILERLRERLQKNELADSDAVWAALRAEATRILTVEGGAGAGIRLSAKPTVVLMVGVNGVGKTTTIGKLATKYNLEDRKVILGAGDTFRAAAVQQLEVWGKRVGAVVIRGKEGADPGAVAFDATTKAKEAAADVLFIDTAGRLHTKSPLMDEIKKVRKTIAKAMDGAPHETLLVLDATTGQNALNQAMMFKEALDLTGIILTKLDGTAKGGIVLGICDELKIPVRYIGLGERAEDLREFHAEEFVEALFGKGDDEAAAA
jgi:fused signal recognition particle receptor